MIDIPDDIRSALKAKEITKPESMYRMLKRGFTIAEVAGAFFVKEDTVDKTLKTFEPELRRPVNRRPEAEKIAFVKQYRKLSKKMSGYAASKELGLDYPTIWRWNKEYPEVTKTRPKKVKR